jgi:hypothetical protein
MVDPDKPCLWLQKMADFLFEFVSVFINRAVVVQSPLFKI